MRLEEIKKMLAEISAFPWRYDGDETTWFSIDDAVGGNVLMDIENVMDDVDKTFIAAAPSIISDLLQRLEVAEKKFELIRDMAREPSLANRPNVWKTGLDFIEEYSKDALENIRDVS